MYLRRGCRRRNDAFDGLSLLKQASNPELENRVHRARSPNLYKERIPRALSALKRNLEERSTSEQEIQRLESELEMRYLYRAN